MLFSATKSDLLLSLPASAAAPRGATTTSPGPAVRSRPFDPACCASQLTVRVPARVRVVFADGAQVRARPEGRGAATRSSRSPPPSWVIPGLALQPHQTQQVVRIRPAAWNGRRGANMELRDKLMELEVELQEQVETVTSVYYKLYKELVDFNGTTFQDFFQKLGCWRRPGWTSCSTQRRS